jgi:hypothetical protein
VECVTERKVTTPAHWRGASGRASALLPMKNEIICNATVFIF